MRKLTPHSLCRCAVCGRDVSGEHDCTEPPAPMSRLESVVFYALRKQRLRAVVARKRGNQ